MFIFLNCMEYLKMKLKHSVIVYCNPQYFRKKFHNVFMKMYVQIKTE